MQKNVIFRWLKRNFLQHISFISITACCLFLLGFKLLTIHAGPNSYELTALNRLNDINGFMSNPLDFIYFALAKLFTFIFSDLSALRITSAMFTLVTIFTIRYLTKYLTDARTSNIGTLLVAASFWTLSYGRIGAPLIMPAFWVSTLLAILAWRTYAKKVNLSNLSLVGVTVIGLYSPVFIWVIVGLLGIYVAKDRDLILSKLKSFYAPVFIITLAPLVYAATKNPDILHDLLGIKDFSPSPLGYISGLAQNFGQIFIKGGVDHSINLGKQPLINIFEAFMMIIGTITVLVNKTIKGYRMLWLPIVIVAFLSVGGLNMQALVVLLPLIFLLVALGFNEFLNLWLKSFPKNPYGRSLGLFLCVILVALSSYYNTHKYFVAWAKSPDVQSAHNLMQ